MRKPSIMRRKSQINGQILLEVKETSKRPIVSFFESHKKSPKKKDKNSHSKNSSSRSLPKSQKDNSPLKSKRHSVSTFYRPTVKFVDFINQNEEQNHDINNNNSSNQNTIESEKKKRIISSRHSVQYNLGKDFEDKFSIKRRGSLNRTKEIVVGTKSLGTINYTDLDKFLGEKEEETKKKINIIEESRKFNREQYYKLEKYIDKTRKRIIDYLYKKPPIYNPGNKNETSRIFPNKKNKGKKEEQSSIKSSRSSRTSSSNSSETDKNENKTITEEKTSESQDKKSFSKSESETYKTEKFKSDKKSDNKSKKDDNKDKNSFNKNYFSNFFYTKNFPNSEYKIKYLDNYFQNKPLSRNFFEEEMKGKNNNYNNKTYISNLSNSTYKTPLNQKQIINRNSSDIFNLKTKNSNYIYPKKLFSNFNQNDKVNSSIISRNKYNNNDLNVNSYTYISSNGLINNHKSYDEREEEYKNILDSIDEKLNYKNKYSFINNEDKIRSSSTPLSKTKSFLNLSNTYKNSFDDLTSSINNNYYKKICDKFDRYNGFKMRVRLTKRPYKNNSIINYKNNYQNMSVMNRLHNGYNFYRGKQFSF